MALTTAPERGYTPGSAPADHRPAATSGRARRLLRGRQSDPVWVRPALLALLVGAALLYLVDLSSSGYANSFYAAAVQAGTKSWKAFFFGSSDASNFITVDKPPAALWVMEISARAFGVNSWSILVPQALEGVAAVGLLYLTLRRAFGAGVAILGGAILALTPVATLMFRFNNPDALLVLLILGASYATLRAVQSGRTSWLVLAGALVGTGFIAKMLQAFLVVPALAAVYLLAGPRRLRRRVLQLAAGGAALVVAAGWWVAAVELTPAADRPYIGGSQDNSLFNLIFGYNGFGRLTGSESGSVVGGGTGTSGAWGPTGWLRMFNSEFGTQISWLLPAALAALVIGLWITRRTPRTDGKRAVFVLFGATLLVTGVTFSLGEGIIHPYYSVALAPAIAALAAAGAGLLWARRGHLAARLALAAGVAGTVVWSWYLLRRTPSWHPWLATSVLVVGLGAALALLFGSVLRRRGSMAVAALALAACLGGPAAFSVATAATAHQGAIPSAGPTSTTGFGAGRAGGGGGATPGANRGGGTFGAPSSSSIGRGGAPSGATGTGSTTAPVGGGTRPGGTARGGGGAGIGGLLSGGTPTKQVVALLKANASKYTWVAATVDSESAASYQLATGHPVMAIGGFNGTDPDPTLAAFQSDVAHGNIHYFIASGQSSATSGGTTSSDASAITAWVESHYQATTVGGVTVYDLTTAR